MKTLKSLGECPRDQLRITLGDINTDVAKALADAFQDQPAVEIVEGSLLDSDCDAIVSPANSFGDMGGGIDKAIDDFHGGNAQRSLRSVIANQFFGELPVGTAVVLELPSPRFPFLVAAPTMRVPGSIIGSINPYLSMRAALVAVRLHNQNHPRQISRLAIPGLGTGVGGISPSESAEQMLVAYLNVMSDQWKKVLVPVQAPYAFHGHQSKFNHGPLK